MTTEAAPNRFDRSLCLLRAGMWFSTIAPAAAPAAARPLRPAAGTRSSSFVVRPRFFDSRETP